MTGAERAELGLVLDVVRGMDGRLAGLDKFVREDIDKRLQSLERAQAADNAVAEALAHEEHVDTTTQEKQVVGRRWFVTAIIALGGVLFSILHTLSDVFSGFRLHL